MNLALIEFPTNLHSPAAILSHILNVRWFRSYLLPSVRCVSSVRRVPLFIHDNHARMNRFNVVSHRWSERSGRNCNSFVRKIVIRHFSLSNALPLCLEKVIRYSVVTPVRYYRLPKFPIISLVIRPAGNIVINRMANLPVALSPRAEEFRDKTDFVNSSVCLFLTSISNEYSFGGITRPN